MKAKKLLYIIVGCIGVVLGAVGVALPILPSVPFLLLSAYCFGRSSERLDRWFKGTRLYKNNLESFVAGEGMTTKTKVRIISMVTILMTVGFFIMFKKNLYIPCILLFTIWIFHIIYFCFGVKKCTKAEENL
ncbi:MAG: YbaN family protein [Eubacteriales bacterium]|nr:YbaN family protein [Eubacteriales bacterium]MDY3333042.1 YbaN family protein [Gallibacter sp.]